MMDRPRPDPAPVRVERYPVLGVMTAFEVDDDRAMAAVRDTYGHWARDAGTDGASAAPDEPTVRIEVRERTRLPPAPRGGVHRVPEPHQLVLASTEVSATADAVRGASHAVVAADLVAERARFVEEVLEPLTLFRLGWRDRQPVHAAGIVRNGAAILLAAPSGTGKSTLTYAASRHGFSVLADEPVYVQIQPRFRVWGRRPRLHLPPSARDRFPELRGLIPVRLPTGKTKLVVEPELGPRYAERAALCVLRRGSGEEARLDRLPVEAAVRELTRELDPGYHLFAASIGERIARVARAGSWSLSLSDDPDDALPLLDQVASELEGSH